MSKSRIEGYKDRKGKFRIRIWGKNGQNILFETSQGYRKKADAVNALSSSMEALGVRESFSKPIIQELLEWR